MTGQPFLTQQLSGATIVVEFAWGADLTASSGTWTWTDETANVRQANNIAITQGRQDETSETSPASCAFELDNTSGKYTPYNPLGSLWPKVIRNTPVRVRLIVSATSYTRFQGYADGFVPSWDEAAKLPIVAVSASGILRRLTQGKSPIGSPLSRSLARADPAYYWPLEDSTQATQITPGTGGVPLTFRGAVPKLADYDPGKVDATIAGSTLPVANFNNGGSAAAPCTTTASLGFTVHAAIYVDTAQTDSYTAMSIFVDSADREYRLIIDATNHVTRLQAYDSGLNPTDILYYGAAVEGWNEYRFDYIYVSGTGQGWWTLSYGGVGLATYHRVYFTQAAAPQHVTGISLNPLWETHTGTMGIGHVRVWNATGSTTASGAILSNGTAGGGGTGTTTISTIADAQSAVDTIDAWHAFRGESPVSRLTRLCGEEAITLATTGTSNVAMGAQPVAALMDLLRDCEAADHGFLGDGLASGLRYVSRSARYNLSAALTADMSSSTTALANPFVPVDDDQRNRNFYTASRTNGGSSTFMDSTGPLGTAKIGTYDSSGTVNIYSDADLYAHASWFVRLGTVYGLRYPTLNLDLVSTPGQATSWLTCGDNHRIDVLNLSTVASQHPPYTVNLLVHGYAEVLGVFTWAVTANCTSMSPWFVPVLQSSTASTAWRLDSGGSSLASGAAVGATSLSVAVSDGKLWSTSAGDYPRDIAVNGTKITVTAVSGASSPQTFTITASPYTLPSGSTVALWDVAKIAL